MRNLKLIFKSQRNTWSLLSVSQSSVKDADASRAFRFHNSLNPFFELLQQLWLQPCLSLWFYRPSLAPCRHCATLPPQHLLSRLPHLRIWHHCPFPPATPTSSWLPVSLTTDLRFACPLWLALNHESARKEQSRRLCWRLEPCPSHR